MSAPANSSALPALPHPDRTMWQYGRQIDHYTAEQMRAFALSAIAATPAEDMHPQHWIGAEITSLCNAAKLACLEMRNEVMRSAEGKDAHIGRAVKRCNEAIDRLAIACASTQGKP